MFARYVYFVDTASQAAFLWSRSRGIMRANLAARAWTEDLVQAEMLCAAAASAAESSAAQIYAASGMSFLMLPLIDTRNRTDYVIGVANAQLGDVPVLLHELHENLRYFSQTIHLLPQAVLTARPDGSLDYASRRWYQITGTPADEYNVSASLRNAAHPHESFFERHWNRGIAGGELFAFEIPLQTVRGSRWFEFRAAPSYDGAHLRKWIVTVDDVHERVEARNEVGRVRARLSALAEIGAVALNHDLTQEQRVERSLQSAALALEGIWAATFTIDGRNIVCTYPPNASLPPNVFDESTQLVGTMASTERWSGNELRPVLRASLDLKEPGQHQLAVAGPASRDAFDEFETDFVREVAGRIASALRNAATFRRESRIARVLQAAMLPVALPRAPGVSFDVSYVAAEADMLVGGDWYDAFELHDGRLAFSIGDVAGHGLDAAVVMGHVREIVRALALRGASPAEVLAETNAVVLNGDYGLLTAILAYLDPSTLVMEYAIGGHAPPLRVDPDGTVTPLDVGDVILGAVPRARFRTQSLRLPRDCAVVLYTDGFVEYAHDAIAGEARLREILSVWARTGFKAKASELAERVLGTSAATDDAAMLILRLQRSTLGGYTSVRRTPAKSAADSRS